MGSDCHCRANGPEGSLNDEQLRMVHRMFAGTQARGQVPASYDLPGQGVSDLEKCKQIGIELILAANRG